MRPEPRPPPTDPAFLLSLGFGLCLRLGDLLLREASGWVLFAATILDSLLVGDLLILGSGEHTHATEGIELSQLHLLEARAADLHESFIIGLASTFVEVVRNLNC